MSYEIIYFYIHLTIKMLEEVERSFHKCVVEIVLNLVISEP